MAAPARSEPYRSGVLLAGKYRLAERLGVGAMGTVWSAVNVATHGRVALKLIERPGTELRLRLLREARLCAAIEHRNVVRVFDVGQSDSGDPFLVMELLRGDTLGALLARRRNLAQEEVVVLARDIARGLAAAHEQGIVHRDLKPANIFLQEQPGEDAPVVKLLDFGVGKSLTSSDGLRTVAGGTIGSPVYMSPEQARGEPDVDFRADIWSLGVVLYEMLTGERPFSGESTDVLFKIMHAAAPRVSHRLRRVDPDIDALVAACLTRDRTQRPASAAAIAAQLDARTASEATACRAPLPSEGGVMAARGAPAAPAPRPPGRGPTASGIEPRSSAGPESDEAREDDDMTLLLETTGPSAEPPAPRAALPSPMEFGKSATWTAAPCAVRPAGAGPRRGGSALVIVLVPIWVLLAFAIVLASVLRWSGADAVAPVGPDVQAPMDPGTPPSASAPPPVSAPASGDEATPAIPAASGDEATPAIPAASGDKASPAIPAASGNKASPAIPAGSGNKASPAQPGRCTNKFGVGCRG